MSGYGEHHSAGLGAIWSSMGLLTRSGGRPLKSGRPDKGGGSFSVHSTTPRFEDAVCAHDAGPEIKLITRTTYSAVKARVPEQRGAITARELRSLNRQKGEQWRPSLREPRLCTRIYTSYVLDATQI